MTPGNKNILIVNVNWIGDVIFSTPFIKAVRGAYPESRIACLLHPRCIEVLEGNPDINEIIVYDEEGSHRGFLGKARLVLDLKKKKFDIAFILHRSFTKALLVFLSGAKDRIGYPTKNRGLFLTKAVDLPDQELHKVEQFLNIARSSGIPVKDARYRFFINDTHRSRIRQLLRENGIGDKDALAVLCPGGNWDMKRWPKENFASLADMLIEKLGLKVVLSGAKKDEALTNGIRGIMKNGCAVSCGKTTLKELGALLERANLVVANDTGPMHLAVAMNAKTIALFGPTSPELTGPYGGGNYSVIWKTKDCDVPCYDMTCADNRCMALISAEEVFDKARELLK